jgi:nicotinamide-nucleotide amidase
MDIARPTIEHIRARSGLLCYGTDEDTLESTVGKLLLEKSKTVAVAESCTGGLVSKLLTDVPGSSSYVKLNVVTYADDAKNELLGVHKYILETKGAVSAECAHAMATGIRRIARADIGLSVTGIAGPGGGTDDKPVGLVYLALVAEHFQADKTLRLSSHISRAEIRARTAKEALNMVRIFLIDPEKLH